MKVLIVAATSYEIAPFFDFMDKKGTKKSFFEYEYRGHSIYPLVTGVGALNTAFSIARYKGTEEVDIVINVGIAGAFEGKYLPGDVVEIVMDRFADLGVEESDGSFTDVFDLDLINKDQYPYDDGWIRNKKPKLNPGLPEVRGLTVNKVTGTVRSIAEIRDKYTADVESMEGAGFLYACRMLDVHCHQIRGISNMIEPRNKQNWRIDHAIDNVNEVLIQMLNTLPLV